MRHRSRRPLLDLLRWRPHLPVLVPRLKRATATGLTHGRAAVLAAVAVACVLGVVFVATQLGGSHGGGVAGDPVSARTGVSVTRGDLRTPLPSASGPSTRDPESHAADSRSDSPGTEPPATPPTGSPADPQPVPTEPTETGPAGSVGPSALLETPPSTLPTPSSPSGSGTTGPTSTAPSPGTQAPSGTAPADTTAPDTTAPETTATTATPSGPVWAVAISANEPASFGCSLDGAPFSSCGSTTQYSDLAAGWHSLSVRATDTAGNVDRSPAVLEWHPTGATSGN
ncbi:MAG TPA: hypothetical protein VFG63_10850 [Nocardioidaceae bacterium]|nr:hypothetical protein [Nocardioidaceae bacterium]